MPERHAKPFNSALETGLRTLAVLVASYPRSHDLGRLVQYDYLTVHSADAEGPPSLHPPLPLRSGELLVRRGLVESGLLLMTSRSLVTRVVSTEGILYRAQEASGAFLEALASPYVGELRNRANWVAQTFDHLNTEELDSIVRKLFDEWTTEFEPTHFGPQAELFS